MINFLVGCFIGTLFGVLIMCIIYLNKTNYNSEYVD